MEFADDVFNKSILLARRVIIISHEFCLCVSPFDAFIHSATPAKKKEKKLFGVMLRHK